MLNPLWICILVPSESRLARTRRSGFFAFRILRAWSPAWPRGRCSVNAMAWHLMTKYWRLTYAMLRKYNIWVKACIHECIHKWMLSPSAAGFVFWIILEAVVVGLSWCLHPTHHLLSFSLLIFIWRSVTMGPSKWLPWRVADLKDKGDNV